MQEASIEHDGPQFPPMPPPPGGAPVPAGFPAPPPMPGVAFEAAVRYATFWQRVGAAAIDSLLYIPFLIVPFLRIYHEMEDAIRRGGTYRVTFSPWESRFLGYTLVAAAAAAAYHILMIHYRGQTIGKMAVAIKVVQIEDGGLPSWERASTRWGVQLLLAWIPLVGGLVQLLNYLWMLWDPQRQCLHDKAARTIVVRLH
jgi:uncharacterized RDD family membrane protein YckC